MARGRILQVSKTLQQASETVLAMQCYAQANLHAPTILVCDASVMMRLLSLLLTLCQTARGGIDSLPLAFDSHQAACEGKAAHAIQNLMVSVQQSKCNYHEALTYPG